jgi:hypothetical protein
VWEGSEDGCVTGGGANEGSFLPRSFHGSIFMAAEASTSKNSKFNKPVSHRKLNRFKLLFITVAQKLNQGEFRKPGCILIFGALFWLLFWANKKVTKEIILY